MNEKEFLEHIKGTVEYWSALPGKTDYEKCNGVAFSILATLDGYSGAMPTFSIRPFDEEGKEGPDIVGSLHDQYAKLGR